MAEITISSENSPGPQPNEGQMRNIIHSIRPGELTPWKKAPVPVTADARQQYLRAVQEGIIGQPQYEAFLEPLRDDAYHDQPDVLYDQFRTTNSAEDNRQVMREILAYHTRGNTNQHDRVNPEDITTLLADDGRGRTVFAFEANTNTLLSSIEKQEGTERRRQYEVAMDRVGNIIYGREWEYLQQIRLLEDEAKHLDDKPGAEKVIPQIQVTYDVITGKRVVPGGNDEPLDAEVPSAQGGPNVQYTGADEDVRTGQLIGYDENGIAHVLAEGPDGFGIINVPRADLIARNSQRPDPPELEPPTGPDNVNIRHIVFPSLDPPQLDEAESIQPPPRPEIGVPKDWRLVGGEWHLSLKGVQDVPRTAHELWEREILHQPGQTKARNIINERWRFDPGGRPAVGWEDRTSNERLVSARFELGAAHRAVSRPENNISEAEYEHFRDKIATLDQGLFLLASYVTLAHPQRALDALHTAAGGTIASQAVDYIKQMLPAFGMYKYVKEAGGLTVASSSGKRPREDGFRIINADDILGQWLVQEKQFTPEVRQMGRRALAAIMQNFEAGSKNDNDWVVPDANKKIMHLTENAAITYRREFSGRYGFGSAWGELRNASQAKREADGHQLVNPWTKA